MLHLGSKNPVRLGAFAVSLVLTLSMVLLAGGTAQAASATTTTTTARTVAHNPQGKMVTRIVGTTANGRTVTGYFTPLKFIKRDGKVKTRGLISGVVHNRDGSTRTFAAMRTMRVKSINGTPATATSAKAMATCDILHLVLAPLDLDLLGLQVHLDRVVLNIVAVSGAGNLLGNLLCAVTGLLDGGLAGQLGQLTNLLNQILAALGLGL